MKLKKFYCGKLNENVLMNIDEDYKSRIKYLVGNLDGGPWNRKQNKKQESSILPNIALYQILQERGFSKPESLELVREYSYFQAEKAHKILKKLFFLPKFQKVFRGFMKKGLTGMGFWESEILSNDAKNFKIDITKCLWHDTCNYFGCDEICEIFCSCDHIVFGNIKKMDFIRSQTLGTNGEKCDFLFNFHNNGKTDK